MDAALKQRLIGATVLVALAVIFLPMLVDGPDSERESGSEQLSLDLPNRPDRPLETRDIPVLPAPGLPTPAAVAPADGVEVLPVVETGAAERVDALSGQPTGSAGSSASATSASAQSSVASAVVTSTSASTPPTAAPAQTQSPTTSSAPAAASPPVPAPAPTSPPTPAQRPTPAPAAALPTATAGGNFAVNVGSYANVTNAESLLARLKGAGIAAYAESVSLEGRAVRRIRLGPFAQRGEAERARAAALAMQRDLPTSIISLDANSTAPAPAPARTPAAAGFAVQLGALRSEADANLLRERARGAGFPAFVERVNTDAGTLWRVRVGPELDRASAERRRDAIKARLSIDGLVVGHP
ncbi:SPOR domain-containing protein [Aquimonas sp.]|jgi:DedD protein|uniref:SPOR domain-containing protein n=1 Tax=Aquimonas sp. TaxID=1872588 RepID=UPI0037C1687D